MGSPAYEPERRPNEGPQHTVTLSPFFIGAWPITQAQWAAVISTHPAKISHGLDPFPSFFKGRDLPVEGVSWNQADEFCRRLAEMTGRDYRLPTEAEWEFSCRAGSIGPFHVGPTITSDLANYCGNGGAVCGDSGGKSVASDVYDGVTYGSGAYDRGPVGVFRERPPRPEHSRQLFRSLRHARQCLGILPGHCEPELCRRPDRRHRLPFGTTNCRSNSARRLMVAQPRDLPLRLS